MTGNFATGTIEIHRINTIQVTSCEAKPKRGVWEAKPPEENKRGVEPPERKYFFNLYIFQNFFFYKTQYTPLIRTRLEWILEENLARLLVKLSNPSYKITARQSVCP